MNNNIVMLIRREVWEHRSLWITPLVLAGILLVIASFGGVHFSDNDNVWFGNDAQAHWESMSPAEREHVTAEMSAKSGAREMVIAGVFTMLTSVQMLVLGVVVFFYLLDCLLAERRDRSILFWKSLPVSDGEVVTAKALTALVVAPLFVLAVSAVMQVLFSGVVSLRLSHIPFSPWSGSMWLNVQMIMLGFIPMVVLWYLPIAGYLLVVSVWVRKNAFLWAVLPPVGLLLIEKMLTHSNYVGEFLGQRLAGFVMLMAFDEGMHDLNPETGVRQAYMHMGRVFGDYHLWLGVLAGLALIYLAIRIRRFRDDS